MRVARALGVTALFIAVVLLAKGVVQLLTIPETGYDVRLLWTCTHYYLRGANPFAASFYAADVANGITPAAVPTFFADLGWPEQVNYPPTSTLTLIALFAEPRTLMYAAFVIANLAAVVVIGRWSARQMPGPAWAKWAAAGVALANLGYSQTLINGNLGIIVIAALVLAIEFRERHPWLSGVCLGVALVKPTLSVPFLLLFLLDRRFLVLAVCGLYLALSTALTVSLSGVGVAELLRDTLEGSARYATGGYALWKTLRWFGWSQAAALAANAAVVLIPFALVAVRRPAAASAFDLTLLASAGLAARLFTYHNSIDNVLLTFLAVALLSRVMKRQDASGAVWLVLTTISVLIPLALVRSAAGHIILYGVWTAATTALLWPPRDRVPAPARLIGWLF